MCATCYLWGWRVCSPFPLGKVGGCCLLPPGEGVVCAACHLPCVSPACHLQGEGVCFPLVNWRAMCVGTTCHLHRVCACDACHLRTGLAQLSSLLYFSPFLSVGKVTTEREGSTSHPKLHDLAPNRPPTSTSLHPGG